MLNVGIIIGSTRPGRNGEQVARWAYEHASQRSDAQYHLVS
jgi:NAD(P)H-dependent FMN reductase